MSRLPVVAVLLTGLLLSSCSIVGGGGGGNYQLTASLSGLLSANKGLLNSILATLHPTLDVITKNQQHVDAALSWLGPGSLGLAKATTHGPWADIYVRAVGPDVPGILCGVIKPQGVTCPT